MQVLQVMQVMQVMQVQQTCLERDQQEHQAIPSKIGHTP